MNTEQQTTQNYTTEKTVHYRQVMSSNFKWWEKEGSERNKKENVIG
jgi:hypothetical protein